MIKEGLSINGEKADLLEGEPAGPTFQANDLSDLTAIKTTFSRKFKLPKSTVNKKLIENAHLAQSDTRKPYEISNVIYDINGVPIVDQGQGQLKGINDFINLAFFGGSFEFFDAIENKTLSDLDFDSENYIWNLATAASLANTTSNVVYPMVQYGFLKTTNKSFDIRFQFPGVYVFSIIEKIFEEAGFDKSGLIFNNTFFKQLVLPFSNSEFFHSKVIVESSATVEYDTGGGGSVDIEFDTEDFDQDGEFSGNKLYTAGGASQQFFVTRMTIDQLSDNLTLKYDSNNPELVQEIFIRQSDTPVEIEFRMDQADFLLNNTITLKAQGDPNVTFRVLAGARMYNLITTQDNTGAAFDGEDSTIIINETFPEMGQKDFIKEIMSLFLTVFGYDSYDREVKGTLFQEIVNGVYKAQNWSLKNDTLKTGEISHTIDGYGQSNFMRWAEDAEVPESVGFAQFDLENKNLPIEVDVYTSAFAACRMITTLTEDINMAQLERFVEDPDAPGDFLNEISITQRLIAVRALNVPANIDFTDGGGSSAVSDIRVGFFADNNQTINLGWESLLLNFWTGLINALEDVKVIEDFYKISPLDIVFLDFSEPIYDDHYNEYFYRMKIDKWRANQSTKTLLFKI